MRLNIKSLCRKTLLKVGANTMLKYINILLDDASMSFCHYDVKKVAMPIPENILQEGIRFSMKENLNIQFIYPTHRLPGYVENAVNQIDHIKIGTGDVFIYDTWPEHFELDKICVLRLTKGELLSHPLPESLPVRLNIVIRDIDTFNTNDFTKYKKWLDREAKRIQKNFQQINILSDRINLDKMNNCNAGWESITLAPDGKFYICPAFYQDNLGDVGDLKNGINIPNPQLYRLDHAPICSHCDAYQCRRCIWLNRKTTLEVNTPSHEQCVVSHLERNASRIINSENIPEINYLDPFDIIEK